MGGGTSLGFSVGGEGARPSGGGGRDWAGTVTTPSSSSWPGCEKKNSVICSSLFSFTVIVGGMTVTLLGCCFNSIGS